MACDLSCRRATVTQKGMCESSRSTRGTIHEKGNNVWGRDVLFSAVSSGDDPFAISVPREIVSDANRWMARISTDAAGTEPNSHAPGQDLVLPNDRLVLVDRIPDLH